MARFVTGIGTGGVKAVQADSRANRDHKRSPETPLMLSPSSCKACRSHTAVYKMWVWERIRTRCDEQLASVCVRRGRLPLWWSRVGRHCRRTSQGRQANSPPGIYSAGGILIARTVPQPHRALPDKDCEAIIRCLPPRTIPCFSTCARRPPPPTPCICTSCKKLIVLKQNLLLMQSLSSSGPAHFAGDAAQAV